ncbi:MAG: DMT family protein [Myxococcales bacterium]|nr:DMT family protein [Myxococcales bacterium]MCB9532131.1 DMT family protein [Myxococcales bacterium]
MFASRNGGPVGSVATTVLLLALSNVFMTLAWYWHLRGLKTASLPVAILASWGIALVEYCLLVPATRIGNQTLSVAQLKVLQEGITLLVFAPVAFWLLREPIRWTYGVAALLVLAAVALVFRA